MFLVIAKRMTNITNVSVAAKRMTKIAVSGDCQARDENH
jgi:hypothetical protein